LTKDSQAAGKKIKNVFFVVSVGARAFFPPIKVRYWQKFRFCYRSKVTSFISSLKLVGHISSAGSMKQLKLEPILRSGVTMASLVKNLQRNKWPIPFL
jgi:hypothetical protein